MNYKISILMGAAGSALSSIFGGWDALLQTLLIFMGIDWITGGFLLPAVFKKSPKSENGTLESRAGWKGLSILENVGLMGRPLPNALKKPIARLEKKGEKAWRRC